MRKMIMSRSIFFVPILVWVTAAFIIPVGINYSGAWLVNVQKSYFGQLSSEIAAPSRLKVNQKTNSISIERIFSGKPPVEETLTFDNKVVKTIPNSTTQRWTSCKWSADNKSLLIISNYQVDDGRQWAYHRIETWKLSDDNRTITIERITKVPDHTDSVSAVYDRE